MKLEVSEQFVREAHESACQTWKQKIEEEFPSLFEVKPIIGKWFKRSNTENDFMAIVFDSNLGDGMKGYGVDYKGNWLYNNIDLCASTWEDYREATTDEVKQMLWKEAEKRGIGKDTKLDECLVNGNTIWINDGAYDILYRAEDDTLWNTSGCIYNQGKFATPLDPNKEIKETISRLEKELEELKEKVSPTQGIGW